MLEIYLSLNMLPVFHCIICMNFFFQIVIAKSILCAMCIYNINLFSQNRIETNKKPHILDRNYSDATYCYPLGPINHSDDKRRRPYYHLLFALTLTMI